MARGETLDAKVTAQKEITYFIFITITVAHHNLFKMTTIKDDRRLYPTNIAIIFKLCGMHERSFCDFKMPLRNKDTYGICILIRFYGQS